MATRTWVTQHQLTVELRLRQFYYTRNFHLLHSNIYKIFFEDNSLYYVTYLAPDRKSRCTVSVQVQRRNLSTRREALLEFVFGAVSTLKEYGLSFSPGGDQVHFTRGPAFFKSVKRNHNWSEPEQVRFTEQYDNWDPFISPDGSKLYFMSNRPTIGIEARMETDIWVIEREHNGWSEPSNLGPVVNSAMTEKDLQASQKMVRCISFSIHLFDFEKDV